MLNRTSKNTEDFQGFLTRPGIKLAKYCGHCGKIELLDSCPDLDSAIAQGIVPHPRFIIRKKLEAIGESVGSGLWAIDYDSEKISFFGFDRDGNVDVSQMIESGIAITLEMAEKILELDELITK